MHAPAGLPVLTPAAPAGRWGLSALSAAVMGGCSAMLPLLLEQPGVEVDVRVTCHWLLHAVMARVLSAEDGEGAEGGKRVGRVWRWLAVSRTTGCCTR